MRDLIKQAGDLVDANELDQALDLINKVLWTEPDNHLAVFVLGTALMKSGRNVQALQSLRRVVELQPKFVDGWSQLCICCGEMHRYDDAIRYARKALDLRRNHATLSDMAYACLSAGDYDEADRWSKEALRLNPDYDDAKRHQGMIHLARQEWAPGWAGYKLTERSKYRKEYQYNDSQEWQAEPDAVVMVTTEQGLGDEIMAVGVVPDAAKACKKLVLDCDHRLYELYKRSFPNVLVTPTRRQQTVKLPIAPTHHKSLFGLCEFFRLKNEDFPRKPYLVANPQYRAMFRSLFDAMGRDKRVIGLCWSGGLPRTGKEERTASLKAFWPLIRREDAHYVSLQYKDDEQEVKDFERETDVKVIRLPWAAQMPDMDLLAALVAELDEVVGVHTTVQHLAGALGVKSTVLTHRGSGWRYYPQELLWYPPSTQMWRKNRGETWRECVARLAESRKVRLAA